MKDYISILIPVYNAEKYLQTSIDSIINQSHKKWKIIAINDGSTDKSLAILKKYKKKLGKKMILLNNKENRGIAYSLNKTLWHVDTEYFCRQDADDISKFNRFEILLKSLNKNTKFDFVSSRMKSVTEKNLIFPLNSIKKFPLNEDFIKGLPFCNAPTIFKSSIIKNEIKFNTSKRFKKRFEDYDFFFQCYDKGHLGFNISEITYFVRQDFDYFKKIKFYDRISEVLLKFKIFRKFKLEYKLIFYIVLPLIKFFFPSFLLKFFLKSEFYKNS